MKPQQVVYLVSTLMIGEIVCEGIVCKTPQYIEIGSMGLIQCTFREDVYSALWYKPTEFSLGDSFLTLVNSVKSGGGFQSGKFDIYPNGSLIIKNVSLEDEGMYTVFMLENSTSKPKPYSVTVFVLAQTFSRVPVVDNCENKCEICFQMLNNTFEISCTIKDARSAIPLRWKLRAEDGDRNISSRLSIKNGTHPFFTSRATVTNAFAYSQVLTLLVCQANDPLGLLEKTESLTLIQDSEETLPNVIPTSFFARANTRLELNCTDMSISYLVWQVKKSHGAVFETLFYAAFVGDHFHNLLNDDYQLQNHSSVVVDNVKVHHGGTYRCISSNAFEYDVNMYEVVVFVYPDPAYPVVDGCNHQQYCVLKVHPEGSLTCTVKGIRPQVHLDITEVFERSSNVLQFYNKIITIKERGDTSDIHLTAKYRSNSVTESRLTIECKVVGTNIEELRLSTKLDLLILHGAAELTTDENLSSDDHSYWITAVVLTVVAVFLVMIGLLIAKARGRRGKKRKGNYSEHKIISRVDGDKVTNFSNGDRNKEQTKKQFVITPEEVIPMISKNDPRGKRDMFISQLKAK